MGAKERELQKPPTKGLTAEDERKLRYVANKQKRSEEAQEEYRIDTS